MCSKRGACVAKGGHACMVKGACMEKGGEGMAGGMYDGRVCIEGGMCGRGAYMVGERATAANSMHLTGMHSCLALCQ